MKNTLFILLLFISSSVFAQSIKESDLVGTWKVVAVQGNLSEVLPNSQTQIDQLKAAFDSSTFEFKKDNNFNFNIQFVELGDKLKNAHWTFDKKEKTIWIQEWENKDAVGSSLMEIKVKQENEKIFFALSGSPLVLEVAKI